jgi:hypothetical protein
MRHGGKKMNERNAEIIRLWNLEIASKDIAAQLSITKNTVIGVITRERDSGSGLITRKKIPGPYQNMKNGKRSHRKRPGAEKVKVYTMPKLFLVETKPEKIQTKIVGVSLFDLKSNGCRFPTSRVADQHYFCGEPKRDKCTSYCAEHHSLSFVKRRKLSPEELQKLKSGYAMKQWLKGSEASGRV